MKQKAVSQKTSKIKRLPKINCPQKKKPKQQKKKSRSPIEQGREVFIFCYNVYDRLKKKEKNNKINVIIVKNICITRHTLQILINNVQY